LTELAVVVLAHADSAHLTRLVQALDDLPIFLHCDTKMGRVDYGLVLKLPNRVKMLPRIDSRISSWSLVAAELAGLRAALKATRATHIAVLSGSDYPLISAKELIEALGPWQGQSYLYNRKLPFPLWNTDRRLDGGEWRVRYKVLTWRQNVVTLKGVPITWPIKRELPRGLELRASSEWKVYSRDHAALLLRISDTRPDLVRFWRSTFIPEEGFSASILGSEAIVGSDALKPCLANPWYYTFPPRAAHPKWLEISDFEHLARARFAPPVDPRLAFSEDGMGTIQPHQKWFARKFSSTRNSALLDRIDNELRR